MVFFDAYALIALISNEPAAEEVERILRKPEDKGIVSVNLTEVLDTLIRREQLGAEEVFSSVNLLLDTVCPVVDVTRAIAQEAAIIRATHYKRRTCELSLADCVLLAAASGQTVVTGDRAVQKTAKDLETKVVLLP